MAATTGSLAATMDDDPMDVADVVEQTEDEDDDEDDEGDEQQGQQQQHVSSTGVYPMSSYQQQRIEKLHRGAQQSARAFNSLLLQRRKYTQVAYNLHTRQRHVPYARQPVFVEAPVGKYPVALTPNQYQEYRADTYQEARQVVFVKPTVNPEETAAEIRQQQLLQAQQQQQQLLLHSQMLQQPAHKPVEYGMKTFPKLSYTPKSLPSMPIPRATSSNTPPTFVRLGRPPTSKAGIERRNAMIKAAEEEYLAKKEKIANTAQAAADIMAAGGAKPICGVLRNDGSKCDNLAIDEPCVWHRYGGYYICGEILGTDQTGQLHCPQHVDTRGGRCVKHIGAALRNLGSQAPSYPSLPGPASTPAVPPSPSTPTPASSSSPSKKVLTEAERAEKAERKAERKAEKAAAAAAAAAAKSSISAEDTKEAESSASLPALANGKAICFKCNKEDAFTNLLECRTCKRWGHSKCWKLKVAVFNKAQTYEWICWTDKNCHKCLDPGDEDKLLICDSCDRGFHTYCASPKLSEPPQGKYLCHYCKV